MAATVNNTNGFVTWRKLANKNYYQGQWDNVEDRPWGKGISISNIEPVSIDIGHFAGFWPVGRWIRFTHWNVIKKLN